MIQEHQFTSNFLHKNKQEDGLRIEHYFPRILDITHLTDKTQKPFLHWNVPTQQTLQQGLSQRPIKNYKSFMTILADVKIA